MIRLSIAAASMAGLTGVAHAPIPDSLQSNGKAHRPPTDAQKEIQKMEARSNFLNQGKFGKPKKRSKKNKFTIY